MYAISWTGHGIKHCIQKEAQSLYILLGTTGLDTLSVRHGIEDKRLSARLDRKAAPQSERLPIFLLLEIFSHSLDVLEPVLSVLECFFSGLPLSLVHTCEDHSFLIIDLFFLYQPPQEFGNCCTQFFKSSLCQMTVISEHFFGVSLCDGIQIIDCDI